MFLIVGLGNPDRKYEKTRHNIGFDTIDALAEQYHITMNDHKHKALCGTGVIEGVKVLLAKPLTYMNLSGDSVAEIVNFYKLDPESEMIVIFDDISLAPGNIRVRKKGSAGGHNGIKSIIARCGTQNFMRRRNVRCIQGKRSCAGTIFDRGSCARRRCDSGCLQCSSSDDAGRCGRGDESF